MYAPLYIKTDNSLQTSIIKINDLIEFAKKSNLKSLTITDNNMYGVMDFYKMCINNSIKPIIGLEIEFEEKKIVLYAINFDGYKNLIKFTIFVTIDKAKSPKITLFNISLFCILNFL